MDWLWIKLDHLCRNSYIAHQSSLLLNYVHASSANLGLPLAIILAGKPLFATGLF